MPIERILLVGGATRMPCIGRFLRRMTGLKAKPSVDPEEAVALGAAVQAGIMDGRIKHKLFNPFAHDRVLSKLADARELSGERRARVPAGGAADTARLEEGGFAA